MRDRKDIGRLVGICDRHLHMHYCESDCTEHGAKYENWEFYDHLKRPKEHDDDGPVCAVSRCKERRVVGYLINADAYEGVE